MRTGMSAELGPAGRSPGQGQVTRSPGHGGTGGIVGPGTWHVVLGKSGVKVNSIIAEVG